MGSREQRAEREQREREREREQSGVVIHVLVCFCFLFLCVCVCMLHWTGHGDLLSLAKEPAQNLKWVPLMPIFVARPAMRGLATDNT